MSNSYDVFYFRNFEKIYIVIVIRTFYILILIFISCTFSGCIAEFLEAGAGLELGGAELLTVEEESVASGYGTEVRGGRLFIADEAAAYSLYDDIRIEKVAGENPKLYVEKTNKQIGEVLTRKGKVRLLDGSIYQVERNVFSVIGDDVYVRESASPTSRIVGTVRQGHMVVSLGEVENGWYRVEIMKNGVEKAGYIQSTLLLPVIVYSDTFTTDKPSFWYEDMSHGNVGYPDEKKILKDIVEKGIPDDDSRIGKATAGWKFESPNEIKSYKLSAPVINGDNLWVTVQLELFKESTGRKCTSKTLVGYGVSHRRWKCLKIANQGLTEIAKGYSYEPIKPSFQRTTNTAPATPYINNRRDMQGGAYQPVLPHTIYQTPPNASRNLSTNKYSRLTENGILKIRLSTGNPFTLILDGKNISAYGSNYTVRDIPSGMHYIKIFASTANSSGNYNNPICERRIQIYPGIVNSFIWNQTTGNLDLVN